MATIDVYEVYPHVGDVWVRMIALWELYLPNTTWTWSFSAQNEIVATSHVATAKVGINDTVNLTYYHLCLADKSTLDGSQELMYFFSRPGMNQIPKIKPSSYGARVTLTDWTATLRAARNTLALFVCNCGAAVSGAVDVPLDFTNMYQRVATVTYYTHNAFACDVTSAVQLAATAVYTVPNGYTPSIGRTDAPPAAMVVSGGSVMSDILEALQDIALMDVDVSFNNGQTIFSVRSKEVGS